MAICYLDIMLSCNLVNNYLVILPVVACNLVNGYVDIPYLVIIEIKGYSVRF